jgi:hypothetical protein
VPKLGLFTIERDAMKTKLILLGGCLFLGACAIGNKHQYSGVPPEVSIGSKRPVAVGVLDQRDYVLDGSKTPAFVGISRGGFGNPFDVTTASERPLAEDFRDTIVEVFKRNGINVREVALAPSRDERTAREALRKVGQERSLLVALREWKSDTFTNTALQYNVEISVYDLAGKVLASKRIQGNDNLGGDALNPPRHAREAVPVAYRKKIDELLNSADIRSALQ